MKNTPLLPEHKTEYRHPVDIKSRIYIHLHSNPLSDITKCQKDVPFFLLREINGCKFIKNANKHEIFLAFLCFAQKIIVLKPIFLTFESFVLPLHTEC